MNDLNHPADIRVIPPYMIKIKGFPPWDFIDS